MSTGMLGRRRLPSGSVDPDGGRGAGTRPEERRRQPATRSGLALTADGLLHEHEGGSTRGLRRAAAGCGASRAGEEPPAVWSVRPEPVEGPDAVALLRQYFAEITVRWFHRETSEQEVDATLEEHPTTGLALFLVLRADGAAAGCLGVHPTGELTRLFVVPRRRGVGGGRVLLAAAEEWARRQRLERLFLDTRSDLVEARALYASCGFTELPAPPGPQTRFQDHWFEKRLT